MDWGIWTICFFSNLGLPVLMIILGQVLLKKPPKNINGIYGYRTSMSMKNKDTWAFAHEYCGNLWVRSGIVMLPVVVIWQVVTARLSMWSILLTQIEVVVMLVTVVLTEVALRRTFDKNGIRKKEYR